MNECAIYVRLSDEDRNKKTGDIDSESIANQKKLLIDYALKNDLNIYSIYSDDDYSGANTDRPEFMRLIEDAKNKCFTTVICKTQSRFTRDMEMVEKYINGLFVELGIHFIDVIEHIDTSQEGSRKTTQINGLINEWYLEDLSLNVKQTLKTLRNQGKYIGSFVCYGYKKDPNDKRKIVVDEPAASIVKKIFELYLQGNGYSLIAKYLNEQHVMTPTQYKAANGSNFKNMNIKKINVWTNSTVSTIIKNQMYTGCMVQGKREKISYKSKKYKKKAENEWSVIPGTHEAIISINDFEKAKKILSTKKIFSTIHINSIFVSKLKCMQCGRYLKKCQGDKQRLYFRCPHNMVGVETCKGVFVAESLIKKEIQKQLSEIINQYYDEIYIRNIFNEEEATRQDEIKRTISKINSQIMSLQTKKKQIYLDKIKDIISIKDYQKIANHLENKIIALKNQIEELQLSISSDSISEYKEKFIYKYKNIKEIDEVLLNELIDDIEIGVINKNKIIKINWKF